MKDKKVTKKNKKKEKVTKKKKQLLLPQKSKSIATKKTKLKRKVPLPPRKVIKQKQKKTLTFSATAVILIAFIFFLIGATTIGLYIKQLSLNENTLALQNDQNTTLQANGAVLGKADTLGPQYVTPPPEVTAKAYQILKITDNGKRQIRMYSKNANLPLQPASLTKIMTALIAMEDYPLNKKVIVPEKCTKIDGSKAGFLANDVLTLQDMLYGLLVRSGADAACSIANIYSEEVFIKEMNKKAEELGLKDTYFENEIGFDANDMQISSVDDITKMTLEALKSSVFRKIVGTKEITLYSKISKNKYKLYNTNDLLSKIPGTVGIKTGYTEKAGGCLSYLYEDAQTGDQILIILLGSQNQETRFEDTIKLLNWAKEQIKRGKIITIQESTQTIQRKL